MTIEFQRFTASDPKALQAGIREKRALLEQALAARDGLAIVEHAADLGGLLTTARQEADAANLLREHAALAETVSDHEPAGWFWNAYATALQYCGARDEAEAIFDKALSLCRAGGWRRLEGFVLHHWGRSLVEQGQRAQAEARFVEALAIRRELEDPRQASTERALAALRDSPALHCEIAMVLADDVEAVRALMARTIRSSVSGDEDVLAATIANVNRNVDYWLAAPDNSVHLKAVIAGEVIGVILVKDFWNLCSLFVDAKHHGHGIGRTLVEAAAVQCMGRSPKAALWLNAATDAIPFYQRLGFVERATTQSLPRGFLAMQRPL